MARQEQTYHSNRTRTADETHAAEMHALFDEAVAEAAAKERLIVAPTDALMADIDEALGENAESEELAQAFVASYVQKGGQ